MSCLLTINVELCGIFFLFKCFTCDISVVHSFSLEELAQATEMISKYFQQQSLTAVVNQIIPSVVPLQVNTATPPSGTGDAGFWMSVILLAFAAI